MTDTYIFYITIILQTFCCGFLFAWFSKKIDNYLRFGEIFGEVRFNVVLWFAKRKGFPKKIFTDLLEPKIYTQDGIYFKEDVLPFDLRQQQMKAAYWDLAFFSKWVTPFICVKCMSEYISFFFTIGLFFLVKSDFNYSIYLLPLFLWLNSITTYYFLTKK